MGLWADLEKIISEMKAALGYKLLTLFILLFIQLSLEQGSYYAYI